MIYQPQPEKMEGNRLEGRAAVAVELKGSTEPVYGAIWFDARMDTDRAERTATIADVSITNVRFPEADEQKANKLAALLEEEIPKWQIPISLDRLLASMDALESGPAGRCASIQGPFRRPLAESPLRWKIPAP